MHDDVLDQSVWPAAAREIRDDRETARRDEDVTVEGDDAAPGEESAALLGLPLWEAKFSPSPIFEAFLSGKHGHTDEQAGHFRRKVLSIMLRACGVPRIQWIPRHRGFWAASNCAGLTPPR
jgi:hypothetical protein